MARVFNTKGTCVICDEETMVGPRTSMCEVCTIIRRKEYNKEYNKEYYKDPANHARRNDYTREYVKEYYKDPANRARKTEKQRQRRKLKIKQRDNNCTH